MEKRRLGLDVAAELADDLAQPARCQPPRMRALVAAATAEIGITTLSQRAPDLAPREIDPRATESQLLDPGS